MKKSLIKENRLSSGDNDKKSATKKNGVKLMSFGGLLPFLLLAGEVVATGGEPPIVLYVIVGVVVILVAVVFTIVMIKDRKGHYDDKKPEENKSAEENQEIAPEAMEAKPEEAVAEEVPAEEPVEEPVAAEEINEEEIPTEVIVEDLVPEEGMEVVETKVNADGDEILVEKDAKGNIFEIRFIKSFTAKLIQAPDEGKKYYEDLKNEVLSYKKTNSRVSWYYDSINSGRNQVIKFGVRGKTLCVYFPLNADDYADSKYKVEKVEAKKYEDVPCLYRIKNDRRFAYAKELIAEVAEKLGLVKGEEQKESYILPYEENKPLIQRGLIKELKVQVNKPQEEPVAAPTEEAKEEANEQAYEELAKEEGLEIVESKVNDDGDVVLVEKDAKGNLFEIRFIKSFTAKMSQAEDVMKDYYTILKNYVLAYKKANSRVSWHYDAVNVGRNMALKFVVRGKTLCVYYDLKMDELDPKYKVEPAKGKKYEDVPCLYRIKNDRRCEYAKDLIDMVMAKLGLTKGDVPNEDYRIPYEETIPLLKKGLIKEQKVRVNKPEPAPAPVEEPKEEAVEQSYEELAKEEGLEIVESKVNDDGDVVLVEKDAKGNLFEIRFIKSFTAKMSQAEDVMKDYYTILKNYVLAYKKANSRVSWHYDAVNVGRDMVIKFAIRGKTLCVYYDLKVDELDPKYKVEPAKGKKYEDVPCLYRIKNDRRCEYAKDLIDMAMGKVGAEKGEIPAEDYHIPYEETIPLLKKGLIKEQKVRVNKPEPAPAPEPEPEPVEEAAPVEEAYQELAKEEGMEIVESKVNNDGDIVLVEKDAKGNLFEIRFIKSFTAKLSQSEDVVKDYYTGLKNYVLAYKKANSRVSWHYDAVNLGREIVIKFAIRGKTLCLYYALVKDGLDPKYKVEDAKGKKFEDVPVLYRIKNDRRYNYAKDLIDMVMAKVGAEKGDEPNEDYRIPYEETMPLLKKGLIKELKVRVKDKNEPAPEPEPEPAPVEELAKEEKPVEEVHHIEIPAHLEHVSVQEADEMMSDEVAEEVIVIKKSKVKHMGKKEVINLDMLSKHFNDGDVVDLESLKAKKLINAKTDYIKVLARGVLDKKLIVKADDFSLQAVKMIALMGGTVKEYK